jgi:putative nucleotidyltransferase with HDIG domain
MLKRIALVAGKSEAAALSIEEARKRNLVITQTAGKELPRSCSAVLADLQTPAAALDAASAIGDEKNSLLLLLADAIDCREGIEPGAAARVLDHATRFAEALGLNPEEQFALERAAVLRDIGKMRIPNEVLLKKSVLDYDEWMMLKSHSVYGAEILRAYGVAEDVAEIIEGHHECWDGVGYPNQLEKEAIPRLARALRLIDVYCAMTSFRHYRKSTASHEDAMQHFKNERGKHFDPELADVFIQEEVGRMPESAG